MSIDPGVILVCQKEIIESGLVLDEDIVLLHPIECSREKAVNYSVIHGTVLLGTAIGAALHAVKNGDPKESVRIGLLFSLPAASSLFISLYCARKAKNQKDTIFQLLTEFRNLSHIHTEVNDFVKQFNCMVETSSDHLLKQSEGTIQDLSEYTCEVESMITFEMLKVIKETHVGLKDISLDLSGFEQPTAVFLSHDSLSDCLCNINFIEGQVVLLRSHLLTSLVLSSTSKGDPAILGKVLDEFIPPLLFIMKEGIEKVKHKLNDIRFPAKQPTLMSLSKLENIMEQRKYVSVPRMRRHIIKINDNICCTLMKLRTLLETLENVESGSQMILLQETLANVTQELLRCCRSSTDLEKLIQLVSRNQNNRELDLSTIVEMRGEDCATTSTGENLEEKDEIGIDSDYQIFGDCMSDSEDDNELNAVRFYKKHINSSADWLAELRQSEEFQRRQNKFHTGKPVTSTPLEPLFSTMGIAESAISLDTAASSGEYITLTIPPPPPIPSAVLSSREISEILRDSLPPSKDDSSSSTYTTPEGETLTDNIPLPTKSCILEENSSLLNHLRGVLDKMGPRKEEQFE